MRSQEPLCLVCHGSLHTVDPPTEQVCYFCEQKFLAKTTCDKEHYFCPECDQPDGMDVIAHICTHTKETDMIKLMALIRSNGSIPIHGPEHHAIVPGCILATYRNLGGELTDAQILSGIKRGRTIPGGSCYFMGICGAASGVGSAFGVILGGNPCDGPKRGQSQYATMKALEKIQEMEAPRCCQRDVWVSLKLAAELSKELLDIELKADYEVICDQYELNAECINEACPIFKEVE